MHIDELYIDGFRSIKSFTLASSTNLQVLVGKNDVGKSNVLRALDLFFNETIDGAGLSWEQDFNINYFRAKGKNAPSCITISLRFSLSRSFSSAKLYSSLITELGDKFKITKKFYNDRVELFYSKGEKRRQEKIVKEGSELQVHVSRFLQSIHYLYVPINKDESWLKQSHIFSDIKNRFIDAWGKGAARQRKVSRLKKNLEKTLKSLKKAVDEGMEEISSDFRSLFPEFSQVTFKTPTTPSDFLSLLDIEVSSENNISTTLGYRGSGVQSASIPLLLFYVDSAKSIAARTSLYLPVWGIEEPESFQHDELNYNISRVFEQKIAPKIPTFISTHSPYFLTPGPLQETHLIVMKDGASALSEENRDWKTYLRSISEEIGFTRTNLTLYELLREDNESPFIVFEGKFDIAVFNKLMEISAETRKRFKDFKIIDGEGSKITERVKLLGNTSHEVAVILDSDDDGQKYKRSIENEKFENVSIYQYGEGKSGTVLESLIPEKVIRAFVREKMPANAKKYWNEEKSRIAEVVRLSPGKAPQGWDKNGFKNKLVDFYTSKYSRPSDFKPFIDFYRQVT